jgi:hypothetical protein
MGQRDGIGADDPDEGQRAGHRPCHEHDAEEHGDDAMQDKHPLIVDFLAQANCANDLEDATDDGPGTDEQQQVEADQHRIGEGDEARQDAEKARRELAFANDRIARLIHTPEPSPGLVVNQYRASEEPTS